MKYTLNLATSTYINRRRLYGSYALIALILVGTAGINLATLLGQESRLRQIDSRLAELNAKRPAAEAPAASAADLGRLQQETAAANALLQRDSYRWTELLDQLESYLADGISIHSLQPDYKTGVLKIGGRAESLGDLRRFIDNLANAPIFSDVYLLQQATEATDGDEAVGGLIFSIVLKRRGGA